ncbi:MAG: 50S ribosomal protein L5 [Proteobacteria bacterium]|nr:50S ribosomal protein L5 [Pseudomonadota bacterium]
MPRLEKIYQDMSAELKQELEINNVMQLPKLKKIVLNIGQGAAHQNVKILEGAVRDLTTISGQKPVMRRAKKSIAGFKLREGQPIGVSVTLRGKRMYEFLDRMINIAVPRVRDFRGFSPKAFDGHGNYTIGFKEIIVFPEIDYDKVDTIRGVGVTLVTSTDNDSHAMALLKKFRFPFKQ